MPCIARTRTNNRSQVGVVATGGLGYAALMTGLAFSGPVGWLIAGWCWGCSSFKNRVCMVSRLVMQKQFLILSSAQQGTIDEMGTEIQSLESQIRTL
jgi:hypothetical protein